MLKSADNTHCGPPVNATRSMFQTSASTTRLSMDMDTPVMKPNLTLLIVLLLSLQCAIAARAQTNGPLRVHPENPRYFTDDSGRAILLAGSHTWPNLVDMGPTDPPPDFDFDAYLAWLQRYGHNFTRGWTWEPTRWDTTGMKAVQWRNGNHYVAPHPWQRTGPGLALDGKPRFDLEKLNPDYLERLRSRVAKAQQAGVFISIMLFEGYGVQFQGDAWPNHPFNPANNINGIDGDADSDGKAIEIHQLASKTVTRVQEAYVRRIVETLNGFDNVLYEISNETHPGSTDWQYHIIRFVKRCEEDLPKQHPVGMTYQNRRGKNETLFSGPADWVSPNSEGGFRDDPPDMQGTKVVLSDTDHLWGIGGDAIWVWKSVTRGLNPIFMDTYDGRVLGKVRPEDDAPRRAMGLAIEYSRRLDLARAIPRNELSSTGYCLAEPGVAYLLLAPEGGEFEVDLTASIESFSVEWLDPATGELARAPHVSGGARRIFRGPFAGATVLFLQNTSPTKNKKLD
ncbi:hypothetical protein Poly41_66210 [Novipirellula artificiosorum]|uniref:DUF6298 domain-containing protein n=2 Tax=Novipirellula artificiosorum TaxID=2528016 RepID=A0A5C6D651_9BACT|nr:hypothetical protein Poly41_66210 [Novipirellula artificiosorum]